jgi:hypothetical protein
MMAKHPTTYRIKCKSCREYHFVLAHDVDVNAWLDGALIQDALSYLTPDDCTLLESSLCLECYIKESE